MEHGGKFIILGWLIVVAGLIAALVSYRSIEIEAYKDAKAVYDELYDNEFARAEYISEKAMYTAGVTNTLLVLIGGVIGGFLIVGIGLALDSLRHSSASQSIQREVSVSGNLD